MINQSILQLNQIGHRYDQAYVIKDIHLKVQDGSFISIIGPSGSGKTTLLNIIGGLLKPTEGQVLYRGKDVTWQTGFISYMPQTHSLMPWRTVYDNIKLASEITHQKNDIDALIERAGFTDIKDKLPSALSGGMKQRVSFLRALNSQNEILLLDEPFSALDELTKFDMQQWLKTILQVTHKTVIMITHNIEEAILLSDEVYLLNDKPAHLVQQFHTSHINAVNTELIEMKETIRTLL